MTEVQHRKTSVSGGNKINGMSAKPVMKIGCFVLENTIGVGTFGKVKAARHEHTSERVAVKILSRKKIKELDVVTKIRQEIEHQQMFKHPHVIHLYQVISSPTDIFMFMEYVSGGELFDHIVKHGLQLISAVAYLHRHRVVHRDLKPENILLDADKNVKVADFGLSHFITDGELLKTSCGSPNYAAPEVITGKLYAGPEVDIWSCGVILYALVTGSLPFDDAHTPTLFKKIQAGHFYVPDHLSDQVVDLIKKMLVVDPMERATMWQIVQHEWFKLNLPSYLFPWSTALNTPGSSISVLAVEATADELGIDECDVLHALQHDSELDRLVAAEYDLIVRQLADQAKKLNIEDIYTIPVERSRDLRRKDSDSESTDEIRRCRWHLGIRSTSRPDDIMIEVFRVMKSLNYEWKMINAYKAFVRRKTTTNPESQPLITLQLYRTKNKGYLLDFMMSESTTSSGSSSAAESRDRSRASSFSKTMDFLYGTSAPSAVASQSRRTSLAITAQSRPRVFSAGAAMLQKPHLRGASAGAVNMAALRRGSCGEQSLLKSLPERRQDDTGLGSSPSDSCNDLDSEYVAPSQTMLFYDMCASLIVRLAEPAK